MYKMWTLFETSYIRESETIVVNFILFYLIRLLENFIRVSSVSKEIPTQDWCIPINSSQNVHNNGFFFFFQNSFLFIFSLLNSSSILCFTHFPLRICRVMVFWLGPATDGDLGPTNPLQWICREWVQKLGSDGATACVEIGDDQAGAKNRTRRPNAPGERTPHPRIWTSTSSPFPVPSATPSDALWAVATPIALSRGHIHINGVRVLAIGI